MRGGVSRLLEGLDGALRYFFEAIEQFSRFSDLGIPVAYLSVARVKASQGDWAAGSEYLEKARQAALASKATSLNDRLVNTLQARFWIAAGDLELAGQWARKNGLIAHPITEVMDTAGLSAAGSEFIQNEYLTLARWYLAQDEVDLALRVIDPLLNAANALGYRRRVIQLLAIKALALQQRNEAARAVEVLGKALALAEPEGYQRVFLDEGEPLARLLHQAAVRGHSPVYTKKILAAFTQKKSLAAAAGEKNLLAEGLIEHLSKREREVLALIAEGLSNREISTRLYISLSTVKGHTANIYGKLGVNSRTQAISEAHRLGLLRR